MLNMLLLDVTQLSDHFECVTLLSEEKEKQFATAQNLKYFESKKNIPIQRLNDLRHSLDAGEVNNMRKLKIYKDSIFRIAQTEKEELEQNYDIINLLVKYINVLQDVKENSNKRLKKMIKTIKNKISHYDLELPLIEFWEFLANKYDTMVRNNSLYIVFISSIKSKIESIVANYTNDSKPSYMNILGIYNELDAHNISFDSEDTNIISDEEIQMETEGLIVAIDLLVISIQDIFTHIEVFIKFLYSSLSALVAYEGTYIQQN
jgi:hypothetical protein